MTVTTGIRISGKISVGIDRMAATPRNRIRAATTSNVCGNRRAKRTMPMIYIYPYYARAGSFAPRPASLFQLHLHDRTGLVGTAFRDHQISTHHIVLAAHDLPDRPDGVNNRRA